MLFHSYTFALFFPIVLLLHGLAPARLKRWVLLTASYVFLGVWNEKYTLLLLGTSLIDYVAAKLIAGTELPSRRKLYLAASMSMNLGLLALFKYYNFLAGSIQDAFGLALPLHHLILPIGISFYTFESMSYTIDVYRRVTKPARDFADFALFVAFFPRLIAGPIMRAAYFIPQLEASRPRTVDDVRAGLTWFFFGLFKKMVIADNLAAFVDAVHRAPAAASPGDLWVSGYAFAFQIYMDFSGYSDMAIGLARLLGYDLLKNFDHPYVARTPSEFWRRWHISLSSWLRDYLYIPLGGSRRGELRTYVNLMITMVLGGLWHGANWTFVAWGTLHGVMLVVQRLVERLFGRLPKLAAALGGRLGIALGVLLTFHGWMFSMVLFRAESIGVAWGMLRRMFTSVSEPRPGGLGLLLLCAALWAAQFSQERHDLVANFERLPLWLRTTVIVTGCWALVLLTPKDLTPFLYFQF